MGFERIIVVYLTNFDDVRIGSHFPSCFDIRKISYHESYGIFAQVHTYTKKNEKHYFQLRKHNKDHMVALFAFRFDDLALPVYWKDSVVLWDSRDEVKK